MGYNILAIRGSPRKRSNSLALLEQLLAGAQDAGAQTALIVPWKMRIRPCLACDGCYRNGHCTVRDDFQEVYAQIVACDALVLSTPVYFGAVSGQVKPLIDRCQSFWALRYVLRAEMPPTPTGGPRRGVLIATAGRDRPAMFDGVRTTFKFLMDALQGQVYAELLYGGCDDPDAIRANEEALALAYETGRRLAAPGEC